MEESDSKCLIEIDVATNFYDAVKMIAVLLLTRTEHCQEQKAECAIGVCEMLMKNEDILFTSYPQDEEFLALVFYYLWTWTFHQKLELKEKAIETLAIMTQQAGKVLRSVLSIQDISLFACGLDL